jgi:hypothetical protein
MGSLRIRRISATLAAIALGIAAFALVSPKADAHHEPANKFAAAGSDVDTVGDDTVVLSETMKVSTPFDLMLQLTSECSILTQLTTNNDTPSSSAYGSVRMHIEIDGKPVPVATDDTLTSGQDDVEDTDDPQTGEVTFCNRAYSRTVTDQEDPADGIDEESDFIRTRTANAFNWVASDVGRVYDAASYKGVTGNNIVLIEVIADYDVTTTGDAMADAFVGSRTLIAEPTNLSVHEAVEPQDPDGGS